MTQPPPAHPPAPPVRLRSPFVGDGPDGARRSAAIDLAEADETPFPSYRDDLLLSATRWLMQAEYLEAYDPAPPRCQCEHPDHPGAQRQGRFELDWERPAGPQRHNYLGAVAGEGRLERVGRVCDHCWLHHQAHPTGWGTTS